MVFHFLFEQSGTFKNVCRNLGFEAYDYDIENDFGETDFRLDLFNEIDLAYEGLLSVFDRYKEEDCLFAFFPCVRFSPQATLLLRQKAYGCEKLSVADKASRSAAYEVERAHLYVRLCRLIHICAKRNLKLVVENPYGQGDSYLVRYLPFDPAIVITDRKAHGDYFAKPTGFWFFGFEPYCNLFFEPYTPKETKTISSTHGFDRSRIHPEFAEYFLKSYVIPGDLLVARGFRAEGLD